MKVLIFIYRKITEDFWGISSFWVTYPTKMSLTVNEDK